MSMGRRPAARDSGMPCALPSSACELSRVPERNLPSRRKTGLSGYLCVPTSAFVLRAHKRLAGRAGVPISVSNRKLEIGNRGSTPTPPLTRLNKPTPPDLCSLHLWLARSSLSPPGRGLAEILHSASLLRDRVLQVQASAVDEAMMFYVFNKANS